MAEVHGNQGSIFYSTGYIRGITISFDEAGANDTISDSANGFVDAGFVAGDEIVVIGSTINDGEYTIDAGGVAVGVLTLGADPADDLADEVAGDDVIVHTVLGAEMGGFFNWSISWDSDVHDTTSFSDGTARVFTKGLTGWTATAERFWLTGAAAADTEPQPGDAHYLRFFVIYSATPAVTTVYYYEGRAICTAVSPTTPVDGIVQGTIAWQGTDTIAWTTRVAAWA
jgi:hypothetical protein